MNSNRSAKKAGQKGGKYQSGNFKKWTASRARPMKPKKQVRGKGEDLKNRIVEPMDGAHEKKKGGETRGLHYSGNSHNDNFLLRGDERVSSGTRQRNLKVKGEKGRSVELFFPQRNQDKEVGLSARSKKRAEELRRLSHFTSESSSGGRWDET